MARKLQSDSFTRKRRKRFYWTLALVIIVVASWLCALSFLTRLSAFSINDVKVFGADADIMPALQAAAEGTLNGDYLGLFRRYSTLIYPKSAIIAAVKAASPRVHDVSVSRAGLHSLVVTVSEKVPAAVVCATLPDFNGNTIVFDQTDGCYKADEAGLLFATAPAFSTSSPAAGFSYPVYYAPYLSASASDASASIIGSYATSTAQFVSLQSFIAGAEVAGIPAEAALVKDGGEYELYASTTVIYFNDAAGLSRELSDLTVFWSHMVSASGSKPPVFDYIDLRYGDNVVYKVIK